MTKFPLLLSGRARMCLSSCHTILGEWDQSNCEVVQAVPLDLILARQIQICGFTQCGLYYIGAFIKKKYFLKNYRYNFAHLIPGRIFQTLGIMHFKSYFFFFTCHITTDLAHRTHSCYECSLGLHRPVRMPNSSVAILT